MSMIQTVRQISAPLLERVNAKPGLVQDILQYRPGSQEPAGDAEAVISLMPSGMRDDIRDMPIDFRARFLAEYEEILSELPAELKNGLVARGRKLTANQSTIDVQDIGREVDLDKAWHGVHFLLCGTAGEAPAPLGDAVLGGASVGEDIGQGPARYLDPSRVRAVAHALTDVLPEGVARRFDAATLEQHQIYPGGWADTDRQEWLTETYARLRAFYRDSADGEWAVMLFLR